eukprot:2275585-Prymnesium_polylepis.1
MSAYEALTSPHHAVVQDAKRLRYSFYTDDEMRQLSAAKIYSSEQRDALQRPLPGGLYDPAMGPTDHYESCVTCGLDYATCPGHFGTIELAVPVYNAMLFPTLVQLLRGTCLHCGAFRAGTEKLRPMAAALDLIDAGLLVDAAKYLGAAPGPATESRSDEAMAEWVDESLSGEARRLIKAAGRRKRRGLGCSSPHLVSLRKQVFHDCYRTLTSCKKCTTCALNSASLRGDGGSKIFVSPLSAKDQK